MKTYMMKLLKGKTEEKRQFRGWAKDVFVDVWGCGHTAAPLLTSTPDG
jgi:hypothetical protein